MEEEGERGMEEDRKQEEQRRRKHSEDGGKEEQHPPPPSLPRDTWTRHAGTLSVTSISCKPNRAVNHAVLLAMRYDHLPVF